MRIGIDLDNTLIDYDDLFRRVAADLGAGDIFTSRQSRQVARDLLRQQPDGEARWQDIQAQVYGRHISKARLYDGAADCLHSWQNQGHDLRIISHKTLYAARDPDGVNLRDAADAFLAAQGLGHIPTAYYASRQQKIGAIRVFAPVMFIDDLPEVLDDPAFPAACRGLLFEGDWQQIREQAEGLLHAA